MYNIASTTGIGYTKSVSEILTNIQVRMKTRNRKIERNPLAALIALFIFSLIVIITIIVQLRNFLLSDKSPLRIPETTHTNQDPDPLAPHAHLEPPQPANQEIVHYFNPRFQDIPDLHFLKKQIRENIDAIFVGAVVPWPEIMEAGFGHGALAAIDREVKLQGGGGEDGNGTREMGNEAHARDGEKDVDTPEWMLALFPTPEHENGNGNGNGNGNIDTSPQKSGEEKPREQKSTCPICTDELPAKVAVAKPCKHRFCKPCLADWMVHLREGKEAICSCPVCGVGIRRVGGGGVKGFVKGVLRRRL